MFGGMKRRGLRAIVERGSVVAGKVTVTLECGHAVTRAARNSTRRTAFCPECGRADGAARDKAKAERDEAAE